MESASTFTCDSCRQGRFSPHAQNDQGYAYFLLPNKYVYIVDFMYQKNVDAINLMYSSDLTSGQMTVHYMPDPRLNILKRLFLPRRIY